MSEFGNLSQQVHDKNIYTYRDYFDTRSLSKANNVKRNNSQNRLIPFLSFIIWPK